MAPLKYNYVKYDFRKQQPDGSRRGNSMSAKETWEAFTCALYRKQYAKASQERQQRREDLRREFVQCDYGVAFPPLESPATRNRTFSETSSIASSNGTLTHPQMLSPSSPRTGEKEDVTPPPPTQPPPPPPPTPPTAEYAVGERVVARWGTDYYLSIIRRTDELGYHVHWECEPTMSILSRDDLVAVVKG